MGKSDCSTRQSLIADPAVLKEFYPPIEKVCIPRGREMPTIIKVDTSHEHDFPVGETTPARVTVSR
jgi:hypothetical protein